MERDCPPSEETVDELKKRLNEMKKVMAERRITTNFDDFKDGSRNNSPGIINSNFLSWVFGTALIIIISVSIYAFYSLYIAILKKFPSHHTEL